jgi:hypothetical protein
MMPGSFCCMASLAARGRSMHLKWAKARILKQGMMQELMTGRIRLV